MPLIRIESRSKGADKRSRRAPQPRHKPPASGGSALPWVAAIAVSTFLVVAAVGVVLVRRDRQQRAGGQAAAVSQATPAAPGAAGTTVVTSLPGDPYAPSDVIAEVGKQQFTYAELVTAVRVARVLGYFTGDAVPSDTSPEMPAFQVKMLRNQIDTMLVMEAMEEQGVLAPTGPTADLVDGYLKEVGGTREQLDQQLAASGVTEADLEQWFADARSLNFFIQTSIAAGKQGDERNALVKAWLDKQWDEQDIKIHFYDPDAVLTPQAGTAVPPTDGAAAPDATP
jgi:hypothetical protein